MALTETANPAPGSSAGSSYGTTGGISATPKSPLASPGPVQQTVEQVALAWKVTALFQRARDARRAVTGQWNRNYNTLWMRPPGQYLPQTHDTIPEIYPIIESLAAWKTDQRPTFDVVPLAQPNSIHYSWMNDVAEDLKVAMQAVWINSRFDPEILMAVFDADTYHIGVIKTTWDASLVNGLGDVSVRRIDPFRFYIDPAAKQPRDANYFVEVRQLSIQDLERYFPGSTAKLAGNIVRWDVEQTPDRMMNSSGTAPLASPGAITDPDGSGTSMRFGLPGQASIKARDDVTGVTILECWMRVPVTVDRDELPLQDQSAAEQYSENPNYDGDPDIPADEVAEDATEDAAELAKTAHPKRGHASDLKKPASESITYDIWRRVVVCGNVVLCDNAATDCWSFNDHPYTIHQPKNTGELYPPSLVEMLAPSQRVVNRLLTAIAKNIELMGDPVLVDAGNNSLRRTEVTNVPGRRISLGKNARPDDAIKWLQPPQVHPQASGDMIQFHVGEMERISGLSAIVRGATPTGRNAQGVIDSVQEAAFVRIRMHLRALEWAIHDMGNKVAALICEFYDRPRIVAIAPMNGEKTSLVIQTLHFYDPSPQNRVPLRFQLNIQAGSDSSMSREARKQEYKELFAIGALDEQTLLEGCDIPNAKVVADRVQQMKAAAGTLGAPPTQRAAARR